jgi:hypothetical protein
VAAGILCCETMPASMRDKWSRLLGDMVIMPDIKLI